MRPAANLGEPPRKPGRDIVHLRVSDMSDAQRLRTYLEGARDFAGKLPTEYHDRNVYDFVLREGRFFEPHPRPEFITLRHIGECFRNAFLTMVRTGLQ